MKNRVIFVIAVIFALSIIYYYFPRKMIKPEQKKAVIAGIFHNAYQVWNKNVINEAEKRIHENPDNIFFHYDVKMDTIKYKIALDKIIEDKVDGAIISIPNQELSEMTVEALNEANIPVVAVDIPLIDRHGKFIAPWFGVEAYTVGKENGKWMGNYFKEKGFSRAETGLLLLTMKKFTTANERTRGQLEWFQKEANLPPDNIFYSDYNGEMEDGYFKTLELVRANPQVDHWMIMGANEEGVIGAIKALEELGMQNNAVAMGIGGYLAKEEFKKKRSSLKAASYYYAEDVGGRAAGFLLNKIINDERIPMRISAFSRIITKKNFIEVMGEYSN